MKRAFSIIKYTKLNNNNKTYLPTAWKSLSVLTNAATSARGSTASHSSLQKHVGMARKTLFNRFSLAYMAAPDPLCPSKSYQSTKHNWQSSDGYQKKRKNTVISGVPSSSYRQNRAREKSDMFFHNIT